MKKVLVLLLTIFLLISLIAPSIYAKSETGRGDNLRLRVFVHYPRPGKGKKPPKRRKPPAGPACTIGPGTEDEDAWAWAGWNMPEEGMTYKVNLATAPKKLRAEARVALGNAFATWHAADKAQIFTDGGATRTRAAKFDGQNIIAWKGLDSSAIAITYVWYWTDTKELAEVDTMFNKNLPWAVTAYSTDCGGDPNAFDVQNIATHEFGHWVGLDDLYDLLDSELTMYGYGALGELKKDTLGLGDVSGVQTVPPNPEP